MMVISIGSGISTGATRARDAAKAAMRRILRADVDFQNAVVVLVNIAAGKMMEIR